MGPVIQEDSFAPQDQGSPYLEVREAHVWACTLIG
jgi:hypothetical protein